MSDERDTVVAGPEAIVAVAAVNGNYKDGPEEWDGEKVRDAFEVKVRIVLFNFRC